ncbi:MAG TPA: hypothetical protein VKT81_02890 [Bryobacteraceae bacterium]|nr:hypothetical protein [Bryobacteraceae bacterium]
MRDLRTPIGLFFALAGVILAVTGLVTGNRAPLETANVNLYCGVSILIFGGVMLWLARRRT